MCCVGVCSFCLFHHVVDAACARHRTDAPSAFHPPVVGVLGTIDGVRVVGGVARGVFVVWGVLACG